MKLDSKEFDNWWKKPDLHKYADLIEKQQDPKYKKKRYTWSTDEIKETDDKDEYDANLGPTVADKKMGFEAFKKDNPKQDIEQLEKEWDELADQQKKKWIDIQKKDEHKLLFHYDDILKMMNKNRRKYLTVNKIGEYS